jgi:hypothetical protein
MRFARCPKFFSKFFPNDVKSTILKRSGLSGRQKKENIIFLRKKILVTLWKHFRKNHLKYLPLFFFIFLLVLEVTLTMF